MNERKRSRQIRQYDLSNRRTWSHIVRRHSDLKNLKSETLKTIRIGKRRQDDSHLDTFSYLKAFANLPFGYTHIKVIVVFRMKDGKTKQLRNDSVSNNQKVIDMQFFYDEKGDVLDVFFDDFLRSWHESGHFGRLRKSCIVTLEYLKTRSPSNPIIHHSNAPIFPQ